LLLFSVAFGCLLPSVEYQPAASEAGDPLLPNATPDCGELEDCCAGVDCMRVPPPTSVPVAPPPPTPRCDDQLLNQDETDVDCGGRCGATCDREQRCGGDRDCAEGLFCAAASGRCAEASCRDGAQNGTEILTDCGGGDCPGCPEGMPCQVGADCASGVCGSADSCIAPTCDDGLANGDETDVDCGGACSNCTAGRACAAASDCESGVCGGAGCAASVPLCCQAPNCTDGVRNGSELALDCGNAACGLCAVGSACAADLLCASGLCQQGSCRDSCTDAALNGTETGVDCGGLCARCADRLPCNVPGDCVSNNCFGNVCVSCASGVVDGTETDIDCGGADPSCRRCNPGERCQVNSDCSSGFCLAGLC
jgi:hypothetical protein